MSRVSGRFTRFSGTVEAESDKPLSLKTEATINAESVNTANEKRDEHLKSADFFNVLKFPLLTFKSSGMKAAPKDKEKAQMTGDLTILGVTKPVTLDVIFNGSAVDPSGATRAGFTARGTVNRKDFGMIYNVSTDKGVVIGDDVELFIEVEAVERKAPSK
jgi:polyisoprenoid-binding protein YceI